MQTLLQDLRYALRMLARNPGFTAVAVLTLALGIGPNASVFSLLNFMLLRPLTVPGANRVVVVSRGDTSFFSYPDYLDYHDRSQAFAALAATNPTEASFDLEGRSEAITAEAVSASYADVIRAPRVLGRWFTDEDQPVAVISYAAWRRQFHADPKVLGKEVRSTAQWYTVVGVAPPDFTGIFAPMKTDLWVPLRYWAKQIPHIAAQMNDRSARKVMIFGRLKPGVTPVEAAANLNGIDIQIRKENPSTGEFTVPLVVKTVHGASNLDSRNESIPVIALLMAVVALVLLIACVNVGNLLLARGAARQRELSIRVALGASRLRMVRQLMIESLLLALAGGVGGLVLGAWTNRLLENLVPSLVLGMSLPLRVDARVMAFTLAVTLLATLLFGLVPAWHSTRTDVFPVLRGEGDPLQRFRLRQAFLAGQVAVSLMLLLAAGLFLRSIVRLQATDPGFAVEKRLYALTYISPPEFTPETGRRFYARTLEDLRALPGVRSAALTHFLPLLDEGSDCVSDGRALRFDATLGTIDSGYLATMKVPLLEGRDFLPTDGANNSPVVIVNETLARRLWPGESALGQRLSIGCKQPSSARVVGVVRDSKVRSLSEAPHPHFYRAFLQDYTGLATLVVETTSNPSRLAEAVRRTLLGEDKSLRIYALEPVAAHVEHSYWQTRWAASLLLIFGLLALALTAVGLYGAIAHWVTQRTREIGVRIAIGAPPREIHWLILRQGLTITLVGVVTGFTTSLALARLVSQFLYGVRPEDPLTLAGTGLLWFAVAALACYLPARRATKVDPIVALRHE